MKKIIPPRSDQDFRISFAQSHNLSVAMTAPMAQDLIRKLVEVDADLEAKNKALIEVEKEIKNMLEDWQQYFYDKLVTEPLREAKIESTKASKIAKHKNDIVLDLGDEPIVL